MLWAPSGDKRFKMTCPDIDHFCLQSYQKKSLKKLINFERCMLFRIQNLYESVFDIFIELQRFHSGWLQLTSKIYVLQETYFNFKLFTSFSQTIASMISIFSMRKILLQGKIKLRGKLLLFLWKLYDLHPAYLNANRCKLI